MRTWSEREYADPVPYLRHRGKLIVSLGPSLQPGDRLVDLACGDGGLADFLTGIRYLGVDADPAGDTLLVRGGLSDILTEEGAEEFLRLCPAAEYVNITGAAHMVAGDRNDVFGEAVVEFLLRHVPVGAPRSETPHPTRHLPPGDHRITDVP